jgi:hypothetical protein
MAHTECSGETTHTHLHSFLCTHTNAFFCADVRTPFLFMFDSLPLFFPFFVDTYERLFFVFHLKHCLLAQHIPHQLVLLCMLMALARVVESGLRQVEGHEWVGFSVPTTIVSTLSGTLFHAAIAPLFMETWLTLIVKTCGSNHDAMTEARFKVMKKLMVVTALPTYGTQVQSVSNKFCRLAC